MAGCCTNPELPLEDEDFSIGPPDQESTDVSSQERSGGSGTDLDRSEQLTTPYTRCTPLFRAIEHQDWEGVLLFLNMAKWSNSMWNSSVDHLKSPAPHIQCKTWVISYKLSKEEWCQLPIHAAISYGAPAVVIQKLVELYPASVQHRDGEGMLPIHLAFGFGSNDAILGFLLRSWPASVNEPGPGGRLPHECCDLGPNKARGEVFRIVAEQTGLSVQQAHDDLWMRCVVSQSERLGLKEQKLHKRHLTDLLTELIEDRAQLQELKEKLKMKYGASSSSAAKLLASSSKSVAPPNNSPKTEGGSGSKLIPSPQGHGSNPPWSTPANTRSPSSAAAAHRSLFVNSNQATHVKSPASAAGLSVHSPMTTSDHPQLQLTTTPKSPKSKKSLWKRGGGKKMAM